MSTCSLVSLSRDGGEAIAFDRDELRVQHMIGEARLDGCPSQCDMSLEIRPGRCSVAQSVHLPYVSGRRATGLAGSLCSSRGLMAGRPSAGGQWAIRGLACTDGSFTTSPTFHDRRPAEGKSDCTVHGARPGGSRLFALDRPQAGPGSKWYRALTLPLLTLWSRLRPRAAA